MADELYQRSPERFTRDPKAKGCGATAAMFAMIVSVGAATIIWIC